MKSKPNDKPGNQPHLAMTPIPDLQSVWYGQSKPYFSVSARNSQQIIPYHFSTGVQRQEETGIPVKLKAEITPRSRGAKKAPKPTNLIINYDEKRQKTLLDVDSLHEELVIVFDQQGRVKFNSIFGGQNKTLTPTKRKGIVVEPGDSVVVFNKELYQHLNLFGANQQFDVRGLVDKLASASSADEVSQRVWRAAFQQQQAKKPAVYQDIILIVDHMIKKEIFVARPKKLTIRDFIATFPEREQAALKHDLQRQGYKLDSAQDLYRLWTAYSNFIPEVKKGVNTNLPFFYSKRVRNKLQSADYIKGKNIEYFVNFYIKQQFSYTSEDCAVLLRTFKALGYDTTSPKDLERLAANYQLQENAVTHQAVWKCLPVGRKTTEKFLRLFLSDMIDLSKLEKEYDPNEAKSDLAFLREITGTDYCMPCERFLDAIYHPQAVNDYGASMVVRVPDFRFTELLRVLVENRASDEAVILSKITAALVDSDNIIHDIDEALHTLNNEKIYDEATLLAVGKRVLITVVQSRLADNGNEIQFAANDEVGVKQVLDDRVHKILGKACNPFDAEKFHQKHRNPKLDYWSGITLTATTKKMVMDLGEQLLKELLQAVDQVESSGQKLQILREAKHHWLFSNNYSTTWIATGNGRTPAMKVLDNKIAGLQAPVELGIPLIAGWKNPLRMGVVR